jgi:hypothetical protein
VDNPFFFKFKFLQNHLGNIIYKKIHLIFEIFFYTFVNHTDIAMFGNLNFLRVASGKFECGEIVKG